MALGINDLAYARGSKIPFPRVGLTNLCEYLGVPNERAHDAYYDSVACAEVYRKLLATDVIL